MCENSAMSQNAALRREARIRKILANSESRLKRIEGINSSLDKNLSNSVVEEPKARTQAFLEEEVSCNEVEAQDVISKLSDIMKEDKDLKDLSDFLQQKTKNEINEEEEEEEKEEEADDENEIFSDTEQTKDETSYFELFLDKRLHIVFLAFLTNVLLFFNVGYLFFENVFCPFYTVKIMELLSGRRSKKTFQPFLILLVANLPKFLQNVTRVILFIFSDLSDISDLFLFLFTFVIGSKILNIQV